MSEIYLVRHGQTDANKNRIVQGRIDNPLNREGIKQAIKTGHYFKQHKIRFDIIVTSPLARAFKTAEVISEAMMTKRPIVVNYGLIERNFGQIDNTKIDKNYQALISEGKVKNMEENASLEKRVMDALKQIGRRYPEKRILIITHSHVIKAILVQIIDDFTYKKQLKNCSITHLAYADDTFSVESYNIDLSNK